MPARNSHRCLFVSECDWGNRSAIAPEWRALAESLVRIGVRCQAVGQAISPEIPEGASQPQEAKAKLLKLLHEQMDRFRPTSAIIHFGDWTGDLVAVCRERGVPASVALNDSKCLDPRSFAGVDAVVCPSRFLADYYRDAFGLPTVLVPPAISRNEHFQGNKRRVVLFDASASTFGSHVAMQIAKEVAKRTANEQPVSFLAIGDASDNGKETELVLSSIAAKRANAAWREAAVFVSPHLGWDPPISALSAMRHGIPVVSTARGSGAAWFASSTICPLLESATAAVPALLDEKVIDAWASAILRLLDDRKCAEAAAESAVRFSERWSPDRSAETFRLFLNVWMRRYGWRSEPAVPAASTSGLSALASAHPWPATRPVDPAPGEAIGWLGSGSDEMLRRAVSPAAQLIVELGAWTGLSTRYLAELAPQATILSVDHWEGSEEHRSDPKYAAVLPKLFDAFQSRCWDWRHRLISLRMSSLEGLRTIAAAGLTPDAIYFDTEHSFETLSTELQSARERFPNATLCGDDYDWSTVREAVKTFAREQDMSIERHGARGWRLLEGWQIPDRNLAPPRRREWAVFVPHLNGIEWECESELRILEAAGVRVVRRRGSSQIDLVRAELFSEALHDGIESLLFIDADVGFESHDALRLLARPEDAVSGVIAKKGVRGLASRFAEGVKQIVFGPEAPGLYPLAYAGTAFFRVHAHVLKRMIDELNLPLCNTQWGRGTWPFFLPILLPQDDGQIHYMGEDWSFCKRLKDIGITPLVDTTIRLWHWGRYPYGWEDAGSEVKRFRSYTFQLGG